MNDRLITVCDNCLKASCWNGIFYCDKYRTAGVTKVPVSKLRSLGYENESYWDEQYDNFIGLPAHRMAKERQPKRIITEHEKDKLRLSNHIAEAIYVLLHNLKSNEPIWQHDPHEFLPANVCCDYAGKRRLINSMVAGISEILDLETFELVMPKSKEELDKCLRK
jgi:hypothetical protein